MLMLVKGNNSWSTRSGRGPFFFFEYAMIVMRDFKYF